jgi:hypothetical protein
MGNIIRQSSREALWETRQPSKSRRRPERKERARISLFFICVIWDFFTDRREAGRIAEKGLWKLKSLRYSRKEKARAEGIFSQGFFRRKKAYSI